MYKYIIGATITSVVIAVLTTAFLLEKSPSKVIVLQLDKQQYRLDTYQEQLAFYNCARGVYLRVFTVKLQKVTAPYCSSSIAVTEPRAFSSANFSSSSFLR